MVTDGWKRSQTLIAFMDGAQANGASYLLGGLTAASFGALLENAFAEPTRARSGATEAVRVCAQRGYHVTATVVNSMAIRHAIVAQLAEGSQHVEVIRQCKGHSNCCTTGGRLISS